MGTATGWETRRRRQAERDREQDDACFRAGREEAMGEARELLTSCLAYLEADPGDLSDADRDRLIAALRAALGKKEDG